MDNKKAGLGALEFGQMINIRTDIYLGSIWVKAIKSFSRMAEIIGIFDGEKALKTIEKISSSEISTPWGCRILSRREEVYDPLNYNYDGVWSFITGFVSLSMYKMYQDLPAFYLLKGLVKNHLEFSYSSCHEVFSGENFSSLLMTLEVILKRSKDC